MSKNPFHNSFKIGKTTQTLSQRFAENYADEYESMELLYDAGTDGALVDWLEVEMIKFSKAHFSRECDNDQEGGGPACAGHADRDHTAKLYVVIK